MQTNSSTPEAIPVQASGPCRARSRAHTAEARKGPAASFALGLLLILPLALAASASLESKLRNGVGIAAQYAGWYFRNGQWRADVRTLVSAIEFITERDTWAPLETTLPADPPAKSGLPAGADSPGAGQLLDADIRPDRFSLL